MLVSSLGVHNIFFFTDLPFMSLKEKNSKENREKNSVRKQDIY